MGKALKIENCKMKIANLIRGRFYSRHRHLELRRHCGALSLGHSYDAKGHDHGAKHKCNLHFSFCNFQFSISLPLLFALCALLLALSAPVRAQTVADKMVATVTNGSRATPDLITFSDLVWQLALEPGTPFSEKPSSANLNRALRLVQDQTLILQEARKLPSADTPDAIKERDREVQVRRDELAQAFGSAARLQERMTRVGLSSDHLDAILRDRVTVDLYLDFRFRAFAVVTQKEITDRYNETHGRQRNTGRIVPTLEEVRARIESELTEEKIETEIDKFIDNLRDQPGTEIVVLSPV